MTYGEAVANGDGTSRYVVIVIQCDGLNAREVGSVVNHELIRYRNSGQRRRAASNHDSICVFADGDAERLNVQFSLLRLPANRNKKRK